MPSCANAYSNLGEGSKDTTAQPITFMNFLLWRFTIDYEEFSNTQTGYKNL